jgi:hypothetical protein
MQTHKHTLLAMKLSMVLMSLSATTLIVLLLTGNAAGRRASAVTQMPQMQKEQAIVSATTSASIKPLARIRAPAPTPAAIARSAQGTQSAEIADLPALPELSAIPDLPEMPAPGPRQQPAVVTTTS